tara:strand:- start:157 stop:513 length:357 start_codon:yes stop_codon:yes gene_type:complete
MSYQYLWRITNAWRIFKRRIKVLPKKLFKGIGILPLKTIFKFTKTTKRVICYANWPYIIKVVELEIHNGVIESIKKQGEQKLNDLKKIINFFGILIAMKKDYLWVNKCMEYLIVINGE